MVSVSSMTLPVILQLIPSELRSIFLLQIYTYTRFFSPFEINLVCLYSESGQRKSVFKVRVRANTRVGVIKYIVLKAEEI